MANEALKPTVPAATPVAPETPQTPTPQSDPRLEQLAKRERAFRAQQRQFQQQQQAFKAEQEKATKSQVSPDSYIPKDRLKSDFINAAIEAGMTHEEMAQQLLNNRPESMEIRKLNAKIAALETKLGGTLDEVRGSQTKAYEQAIKQVSRDVKVTTHGNEAFEIINSKGQLGQDAVTEYIKTTYEEDGILLSAEEAAQEVEEYLLEEATSLLKLKKVQAKLAPPEAPKNPEQKTPPQKTQTLTQSASTSTSAKSSAAERRNRAILAAQGLLK